MWRKSSVPDSGVMVKTLAFLLALLCALLIGYFFGA
jgi:hypothetical protein